MKNLIILFFLVCSILPNAKGQEFYVFAGVEQYSASFETNYIVRGEIKYVKNLNPTWGIGASMAYMPVKLTGFEPFLANDFSGDLFEARTSEQYLEIQLNLRYKLSAVQGIVFESGLIVMPSWGDGLIYSAPNGTLSGPTSTASMERKPVVGIPFNVHLTAKRFSFGLNLAIMFSYGSIKNEFITQKFDPVSELENISHLGLKIGYKLL